jgi:hypothetical protein
LVRDMTFPADSPNFSAHCSAALAAHLASLSEGLDRPRDEIETHLDRLLTALVEAVPSLLAMTVTVTVDGYDFSFTAAQPEPSGVRTSLLIPLPSTIAAGSDSTLVLYAATPGTFIDLAADLAHALHVELATLILDAHLSVPEPAGMSGLHDYTTINRAIGVLIARGDTPEAAQQRLHRLASQDGGNLAATAAELLDALPPAGGPHPDDDPAGCGPTGCRPTG